MIVYLIGLIDKNTTVVEMYSTDIMLKASSIVLL